VILHQYCYSKVDLKVPIVDPIKSIAEVANKASLQGLPNIKHWISYIK